MKLNANSQFSHEIETEAEVILNIPLEKILLSTTLCGSTNAMLFLCVPILDN